jgi:DNA-binding PadR family transcriptional regulator
MPYYSMPIGKGLEKNIIEELSSGPLKRSTRTHLDILQQIAARNQRQWEIGELKQELRRKYKTNENAGYHLHLLLHDGLIVPKGSSYCLSAYSYTLLSPLDIHKLVGDRGLERVDLSFLLDLLNAKSKKRKCASKPLDISKRLDVDVKTIYKSASRLQTKGLIEGCGRNELPKLSQTMYRLTDGGRRVCEDAICGAMATKIVHEYQPPRWVSIAELMNRRQRYSESVQRLIQKSFAFLSANPNASSDLCAVTYNMPPWIEQISTDFVMENYMKPRLEQEKDSTGLRIDRNVVLTGSETVSSLVNQTGSRIYLFALESLHLEEAQPIVENSVLVGAMEGPMAYCVVGVGTEYTKAFYESETIYSKRLVMDVAKKYDIKESQIESVSGHSKYLKAIDAEAHNGAVFHVKAPFAAVMKTQFQSATVLARIPIVLGVFVSADEEVGIFAGVEFSRIIHESLRILSKPQIYANAVLHYVHELPKIDPSFNRIHVISQLRKCGVKGHAE